MAFTGVLGIELSHLGNIQLANPATSGSSSTNFAAAQSVTTLTAQANVTYAAATVAQAQSGVNPRGGLVYAGSVTLSAEADMVAPAIGSFGSSWLELPQPVNFEHHLNDERLAWWLIVPGLDGGNTLYDLMGNYPGAIVNCGWSYLAQPFGYGTLYWNGTQNSSTSPSVWAGSVTLPTPSITLSAWFNASAGVTGNGPAQILTVSSSNSATISVRLDNFAGHIVVYFSVGSTDNAFLSTVSITTGQWYHVVAVYDGTSQNLYVNGVLDTAVSDTAVANISGGFYIGSNYPGDNLTRNFSGYIGDVSVWTRALSSQEAQELYTESLANYPQTLNRRQITFNRTGLAASVQHNASTNLQGSASLSGTGETTVGIAFADSYSSISATGIVYRNGAATAQSISTVIASQAAVAIAKCASIIGAGTKVTHNATATAQSFTTISFLQGAVVSANCISSVSALGSVTYNAVTTLDSKSSVSAPSEVTYYAAATLQDLTAASALGSLAAYATASVQSITIVNANGLVNVIGGVATAQSISTLRNTASVTHYGAVTAQSKSSLSAQPLLDYNAIALVRVQSTVGAPSRVTHNASTTAQSSISISANGLKNVINGTGSVQSYSTMGAVATVEHKATAKAQAVTSTVGSAKASYRATATVRAISSAAAPTKVTHSASTTAQAESVISASGLKNVVAASASLSSYSTISGIALEIEAGKTAIQSVSTVRAVGTRTQHMTALAQSRTTISAQVYTAVSKARAVSTFKASIVIPSASAQSAARVNATAKVTHYAVASVKSASTVKPNFTLIKYLPDYNNTVLWFMADQGITQDGLGNVTNWTDQSFPGSEYGYQNSTFARPALVRNTLNSLPIVRFNGSSQFLNVANSAYMVNNQPWTIIALVKDVRTDNVERDIISNVAVNSLASAIYLATVGTNPTQGRMTDYFGGPDDPYNNTSGKGVLDIVDADTGGYFIYVGAVDNGNHPYLYEEDALVASDPNHSIPNRDWSQPWFVGRRGGLAQNYWNGDIAELIVWNTNLSYSQIQTAVNYLKKKWFNTQPVDGSRSTAWNDFAALTVDVGPISTEWNVYVLPTIRASTLWNVAANPPTTVDAGPVSTQWNVRVLVDATRSTTWNDLHRPITDVSISTTWNVLHRPITDVTRSTLWNDEKLVESSPTATTWNVRRVKTKFRTAVWNVSAHVNATSNTTWNDRILVGPSVVAKWNVRAVVDAVVMPRTTALAKWDVINDGDTLTTNLQQYAIWDDQAFAIAVRRALFNVLAHVDKTAPVAFDDRVLVDAVVEAVWNVHHSAIVAKNTYWNVMHLGTLMSTLWNVHTKVDKTASPTWKEQVYNQNVDGSSWNVRVLVDAPSRTAIWNMLPPPVIKFVAALWNVGEQVEKQVNAKWNVQRNKQLTRTTYWNVMTGKVNCSTPIPTQLIDIKIQGRWNVYSNSGLRVSRVVRWNDRHIVDAPTRLSSWRVLASAINQRITTWRITLYTTDKTVTALWIDYIHADVVRGVDFNVRIPIVNGPMQRSTSWDVRQAVGIAAATNWNDVGALDLTRTVLWNVLPQTRRETSWNVHTTVGTSAGTSWGDRQLVSATRSTTWAITIDVRVGTSWNDKVTASTGASTSWNVRRKIPQSASTSWNVHSLAAQIRSTTWWYSTVSTAIDTSWQDKVTVVPADPGVATLWMNFPMCSEEFVKAAYRGAKKSNGAILPKITVCELAREGDKNIYRSKYDRTRKRFPVKGVR